MPKLVPVTSAPVKTDLAAAVAPKLEAARARLLELEAQVGAAALAVALDPGAGRALGDLNVRLDGARRDVSQLEAALATATQRDNRARVAFESHARQVELQKLRSAAAARVDAMAQCCEALETAAKAYGTFLELGDRMAALLPTGMIAHHIEFNHLDCLIGGVGFPAPSDKILASEMFRHAPTGDDGKRRFLPGAFPIVEQLRLQPNSIEPAVVGVKRQGEYVIGLLSEKIDAIERSDLARLAS